MTSITRRLPTLFGFLGSCIAVLAVAATGVDAAKALGGLTEGARLGAIAAMARGGQIRSPLSGADGAAMLQGTTQGARAGAISELATLFKADLSGQEAEAILGPESVLSEGNRQNAITALARAKRFGPSIGDDAALALKGTTQGARAGAIGEIAPYLRVELPGQALATVLGSASVLTDGNRQNAITAIARSGRRPMPLSGADGAAILLGATQGARAGAISELATLFKADLSGQEAEAILGPESVLSEGNRQNAITALARAKRFGPSIGEDAALALKGTTQGARAGAISEIATYLRDGMSAQAIASILGDASVLSEGNRYSAIISLIRAGKLHSGYSSDAMAVVLQGMSGQTRAGAITQIAMAPKQPNATAPLPIGGAPFPSTTAGTTPSSIGIAQQPAISTVQVPPVASPGTASASIGTSAAMAAIDARIVRLRKLASSEQPYLYESTGGWSDISVVARDLPARVLGFTDYRALYDQLYFAAAQYTGLTSRWITKGQIARGSGDLGAATRCLDHATLLLRQRQLTYDAAVAVSNEDLARATTYVKATYEASKWAAGIVASATGIPGASTMVDVAGGLIDFALNVQDGGWKNGARQSISDVLTTVIVKKMPIAELNGRTLENALQNQAGKLLANANVIGAIHAGIRDAAVRKVVVDGAKSLLAATLQGQAEDQINQALDRLVALGTAGF